MISLFRHWYLRHFSAPGTAEFALVLIGAFIIVYYFMWLVGPLVVALCLAYCLDWGVRLLIRRTRLSRRCASAVIMGLFVGFASGILVFIAPKVLQQGNDFYQTLQQVGLNSSSSEGVSFDDMISSRIHDFIVELPDPIPSMLTKDDVSSFVERCRTALLANITNIVKYQIMPSVVNTLSWLMYMVIVPIFMFLMLANKDDLKKRFGTYLMPSNQTLIHEFWPKINSQIEGYIRGKVLHVIIIALVNTLAFMLLGVNYAFLLGFGVGLSVVIPYVGAIIISIPVLLVAFFEFGFSGYFGAVCAVYLLIQILDGNVLTPILFSKAMNLDAFSILTAIFVFGGLWGFWGVFFSIPLATFIRTLFVYWPTSEVMPEKSMPLRLSDK